jgi:hypothetical protein
MRYYFTKNRAHQNGWRDALERLLTELDSYYRYSASCGYSETNIYIQPFLLASKARIRLREWLYGKKIIVEVKLESMDVQFEILITHVTDFTNPVSDNIACNTYNGRYEPPTNYFRRKYQRTENLFIALSQADQFILGLLHYMQGRNLNLITLSHDWEDGLIQSFGSLKDLAFPRLFLANV